jgi:hypothetical protein
MEKEAKSKLCELYNSLKETTLAISLNNQVVDLSE